MTKKDMFDNTYHYVNSLLHKDDGPALEYVSGSKFYFVFGKLHREDGPAYMPINEKHQFFINGVKYSEKEYYRQIKLLVFK